MADYFKTNQNNKKESDIGDVILDATLEVFGSLFQGLNNVMEKARESTRDTLLSNPTIGGKIKEKAQVAKEKFSKLKDTKCINFSDKTLELKGIQEDIIATTKELMEAALAGNTHISYDRAEGLRTLKGNEETLKATIYQGKLDIAKALVEFKHNIHDNYNIYLKATKMQEHSIQKIVFDIETAIDNQSFNPADFYNDDGWYEVCHNMVLSSNHLHQELTNIA